MSTATAETTASGWMVRALDRNLAQVGEYQKLCDLPDEGLRRKSPSVSQWDVGQQVDHILKGDGFIIDRVLTTLQSPPENVDGRPIVIGRLVLLTGFILRGKGKAPERTLPERVSGAPMRSGFEKVRSRLEGLRARLGEIERSPGRSPHPVLGQFTGAEWLRFMDVHHAHHLKIIRDIRAQGGA